MKKKKNIRKMLKIVIPLSIVFSIILVIATFLIFNSIYTNNLNFTSAGALIHRNSIKDINGTVEDFSYTEYDFNNYDEYFCYSIENFLPKDINNGSINQFCYSSSIKKVGYSKYYNHELYFKWETTESNFDLEVERIRMFQGHYNEHPLYSNNLFPFPAYILSYNESSKFEYLLMDEDTYTLYYIYFNDVGSSKNIVFDHNLAPKIRIQDSDIADYKLKFSGGYSIF